MMRCRWIGIVLGVILSSMAFADEPAVDPEVVGTWSTVAQFPAGNQTFTWTITRDGRYSSNSSGATALPAESGTVAFAAGKWSLKADSGRVDGGTYNVHYAQTVVITGVLGAATWSRAKNDAPPVASEKKGPPGPIDYALPVPGEAHEDLPADTPGLVEFGQALQALGNNRYADATDLFDRAIKATEKPEFFMAGGVAKVCSNDLAGADVDFAAARKLKFDNVAYTWSAAVAMMRGGQSPGRPTVATSSDDADAMQSYALLLGHAARLYPSAAMLSNENQWPLCQKFVQRALDLGSHDVGVLLLYMDFCTADAEQRFSTAGRMRRPQVVSFSSVTAGDGTVTNTTVYRMPSCDDLAQAASLEDQSVQVRRKGAQPVLDAIKQNQGTRKGYYLTAKYYDWIGKPDLAEQNMRTAVAMDPYFKVVHGQAKVTLQKINGGGDTPEKIEVIEPAKPQPAPQQRAVRNNAAK